MMRVGLAALALLLITATAVLGQTTTPVMVTGYLTDTLCGARGTNARHADHARRSVASGKAKYALYVETQAPTARGASIDGKLYILESASQAAQLLTQYAGQRIRITGTVSATPIRTAGQSYALDAVATVRVNGASRPVNATTANPSTADAASGQARVQQHNKALDTTTPVAGVLTITGVEIAPR